LVTDSSTKYYFKGHSHYFVGYPIIPWIGVMSLGYCLGTLYTKDFPAAKEKNGDGIWIAAIPCSLSYGTLINMEISFHWSPQNQLFTFLSFF